MSWGAVGGAVASAVVGQALSKKGGGGSSQTTTPLPFSVGGRLSGAQVDQRGRTATLGLDPTVERIQSNLLNQALLTSGPAQDPAIGAFGQQALQGAGGFLSQAMQPQLRGTEALQGAFGTLGQQFDPFGAAQAQFERLESVLSPERERQRQAQEARLFAQGRLGSTGGGVEQQALEGAIEQSRRANLAEALGQAQSIQQQELARAGALGQLGLGAEQAGLQRQQVLAGLGTGLGAFGAGLPLDVALQRQQLGLGALQGAFIPEGQALEQLRIGGGLGGATTTASASSPSFGQQVGTGLMQAGVEGITSGIQRMFGNKTPTNEQALA